MGNCKYCPANPEPDLQFVTNRLKPLYPPEFYNDTTLKIAQDLGQFRFEFKHDQLPEKITHQPQPIGPPITQSNGSKYYGQLVNNRKHGQGRQVMPDYTLYEGYWANDKPQGKGRMIFPNGSVFEGDWVDGNMEGKGYHKTSKEIIYDGEWKKGKPHGFGSQSNQGITYKGQYQMGLKQGKGEMKWPNNNTYEGCFKQNKLQGQGKMVWSGGKMYQGQWKNNMMHGQGTLTFTDGRKYIGEFKEDLMDGKGTFEWPDGRKYQSEWKAGMPEGRGEFRPSLGTSRGMSQSYDWKDGKISQKSISAI